MCHYRLPGMLAALARDRAERSAGSNPDAHAEASARDARVGRQSHLLLVQVLASGDNEKQVARRLG